MSEVDPCVGMYSIAGHQKLQEKLEDETSIARSLNASRKLE